MKKPELHRKLKEHFETKHSVDLKGWDHHVDSDQNIPDSSIPISQTIDKLRHRIKVGCCIFIKNLVQIL